MISRKVRIELAPYDADWKDSFIMVSPMGYRESIDYQKKTSKIQREMYESGRDLARIQSKLDFDSRMGTESPKELIEEERVLSDRLDELSLSTIELLKKVVKMKFVSGSIYDSETKKQRPLTKEDIVEFDKEIFEYAGSMIMGTLPKKN